MLMLGVGVKVLRKGDEILTAEEDNISWQMMRLSGYTCQTNVILNFHFGRL